MKIGQSKSKDVKLVTEQDVRQSSKARLEKETVRKLITSGSIVPEVWIMFGLLLSLVMQTGLGNRKGRK